MTLIVEAYASNKQTKISPYNATIFNWIIGLICINTNYRLITMKKHEKKSAMLGYDAFFYEEIYIIGRQSQILCLTGY